MHHALSISARKMQGFHICFYVYAALSRLFSLEEMLLMVRRLMQLMLVSLVRTRFACAFNMKFKEAE